MFQTRTKISIGLLVAGVLLTTAWLYRIGLAGIPFVLGQLRSPLGGHWEVVDVTTALGHPSTRQRLIQRRGPIFLTVAKNVGLTHYLGDNCISYEVQNEKGHSTWAACAFNAPVELYRGFGRALFQEEELLIEEFDQGEIVPARRYTFAELRALARGR